MLLCPERRNPTLQGAGSFCHREIRHGFTKRVGRNGTSCKQENFH
jgi:hypothetical protein